MLVATSVLFMAIAYVATSASIFVLRKKYNQPKFRLRGGLVIPSLGGIFSIYLITQCSIDQIMIGAVLLAFGVIIYIKFSPKKELTELKRTLLSRKAVLERTYGQEQRFLAHFLHHIKRAYRRITGKKQAWTMTNLKNQTPHKEDYEDV